MTEPKETVGSAEQAYAAAASEANAEKTVSAAKPVARKAPVKKAKAPARKKSVAARRKPAVAKKTAVTARKAPAKRANSKTKNSTVSELKELIMATKTKDFTETVNKTVTDAVADMQTKAQEAYDKTSGLVAEATEVAKGNVEAFVESSKIVAGGVQEFGKSYAAEAKTAYETLTADMKEVAAVKSPTELFQLQGKILRRNFDAAVAATSKNSEAAMKLANDAFAPISGRVNLAVEKLSKVA